MRFGGIGSTFVYVVVRRVVFDFGIDFKDSPLLGGVSCEFFTFCL